VGKHWLHYQARSLYVAWGRAAGFVLGFWLGLLLLMPMVVPESSESLGDAASTPPEVSTAAPEAPDRR
jgi:hypothetical protein